MKFERFTDIRAWKASRTYKLAVYHVITRGALARDRELQDQLKASVKGPPAHIAEGFGRFYPNDFARFVRIAHASLLESQNHLVDAVDAGYITEAERTELDRLALVAIKESAGLIDYLQSEEAQKNAERAKARRAKRHRGRTEPEPEPEPEQNNEP